MKTVKELKKELEKFEDDDLCYAYEGELIGIIVNRGEKQGVIFIKIQTIIYGSSIPVRSR